MGGSDNLGLAAQSQPGHPWLAQGPGSCTAAVAARAHPGAINERPAVRRWQALWGPAEDAGESEALSVDTPAKGVLVGGRLLAAACAAGPLGLQWVAVITLSSICCHGPRPAGSLRSPGRPCQATRTLMGAMTAAHCSPSGPAAQAAASRRRQSRTRSRSWSSSAGRWTIQPCDKLSPAVGGVRAVGASRGPRHDSSSAGDGVSARGAPHRPADAPSRVQDLATQLAQLGCGCHLGVEHGCACPAWGSCRCSSAHGQAGHPLFSSNLAAALQLGRLCFWTLLCCRMCVRPLP